jgi:HD-like signal output (HDOD) protein
MTRKLFKSWFSSAESATAQGSKKEIAGKIDPETSPQVLSSFTVFAGLPEDELIVLAGLLEVRPMRSGDVLFQQGEDHDNDYLLLDGNLKLTASDGVERLLIKGSDKAKSPIAALRPFQYTATAVGQASVLVVDRKLLEQLVPGFSDSATSAETMGVATVDADSLSAINYSSGDASTAEPVEMEIPSEQTVDADQLEHSFLEDLRNDRFVLSSLPEVAIQLRNALEDPDVSADDIGAIIKTDPATAAKIIKAANSPLYRTWDNCDTVTESVVRLGVHTTRQLVLSFTLKDQFRATKVPLRNLMRDAWQAAIYHAAIAWAMAKNSSKFSPEEAMSAALLSNIGVLSVCNYLDNHPEIYEDPERLRTNVRLLKARVGASLLEKWGLSENMVECARNSDNWQRQREGDADLCDLVLVAALHAYIGRVKTPKIGDVGAFQRLSAGGTLDPEMARNFLEFASHQVQEARELLNL